MANTKYIPDGFHTVTPYLIVKDGNGAVEFYKSAFGATVTERMEAPDGRLRQAEFKIGDSQLMLGEHPEVAEAGSGFPAVSIYLYVENADATARKALAAGAKELSPVSEKFYGNREGGIQDPFGITWWIATRVTELSEKELQDRMLAQQR